MKRGARFNLFAKWQQILPGSRVPLQSCELMGSTAEFLRNYSQVSGSAIRHSLPSSKIIKYKNLKFTNSWHCHSTFFGFSSRGPGKVHQKQSLVLSLMSFFLLPLYTHFGFPVFVSIRNILLRIIFIQHRKLNIWKAAKHSKYIRIIAFISLKGELAKMHLIICFNKMTRPLRREK